MLYKIDKINSITSKDDVEIIFSSQVEKVGDNWSNLIPKRE